MHVFYLIKAIPVTSPAKIAEQYLIDEFKLNHKILEPLLRIQTFLSSVTLDEDGVIEQLQRRKTKNGNIYYSFMDEYIDPFTAQVIRYEIVKKIISQMHVYEIRFISRINHINRNCRILFTINQSKSYLVLTHGLTKTRNDDF